MWFVWFLLQVEQIFEGNCCIPTQNFWRYCHITQVSVTKQNKKYFDQLLIFLVAFLEESLCLLKAEIKVTVSLQIGREIAENYMDSFILFKVMDSQEKGTRGKWKWLCKINGYKIFIFERTSLSFFFFFLSLYFFFCLYSMYLQQLQKCFTLEKVMMLTFL